MFDPIKIAFSHYLERFFAELVPTNREIERYIERPSSTAILYAPGRMVDSVEDMLAKWRKLDQGHTVKGYPAPVMIFAMDRNLTPTGRDYTRQLAEKTMVTISDDPKKRVFGLKTIAADVRLQTAIISHLEPTARSIAAQLLLYVDSLDARRFTAEYAFAGFKTRWPVQIESPETPAMLIPLPPENNLTCYTVDLNLHCSIPLFYAPKIGEANDGKGTPGDADDPAGYPVVKQITIKSCGRCAPHEVKAEEVEAGN